MSFSKIIEYVKNTPGNTNPSVINSMVAEEVMHTINESKTYTNEQVAGAIQELLDCNGAGFEGKNFTKILSITKQTFANGMVNVKSKVGHIVENMSAITEGSFLRVFYDGEWYDCKTYLLNERPSFYAGNRSKFNGKGDTGEPFYIRTAQDNLLVYDLTDRVNQAPETIHVVGIYLHEKAFNLIDSKYLSNDVARVDVFEDIVVPKTVLNIEGAIELEEIVPIEASKRYEVDFDNQRYSCICSSAEDETKTYLGNLSFIGGSDTLEPFLIETEKDNNYTKVYASMAGEHNLQILGQREKIYYFNPRVIDVETKIGHHLAISEVDDFNRPKALVSLSGVGGIENEGKIREIVVGATVQDDGVFGYEVPITGENLVVGERYKVIWDGEEYHLQAVDPTIYNEEGSGFYWTEGSVLLGNGTKQVLTPGNTPNTGEPFMIIQGEEDRAKKNIRVATGIRNSTRTYTLDLYRSEEKIYKSSPRILPEATETTLGAVCVSKGGSANTLPVFKGKDGILKTKNVLPEAKAYADDQRIAYTTNKGKVLSPEQEYLCIYFPHQTPGPMTGLSVVEQEFSEKIEVVYNNTTYILEKKIFEEGGFYWGNLGPAGAGEDSGEPFVIMGGENEEGNPDYGIFFWDLESSETLYMDMFVSRKIGIYAYEEGKEKVHPIDYKYLPQGGVGFEQEKPEITLKWFGTVDMCSPMPLLIGEKIYALFSTEVPDKERIKKASATDSLGNVIDFSSFTEEDWANFTSENYINIDNKIVIVPKPFEQELPLDDEGKEFLYSMVQPGIYSFHEEGTNDVGEYVEHYIAKLVIPAEDSTIHKINPKYIPGITIPMVEGGTFTSEDAEIIDTELIAKLETLRSENAPSISFNFTIENIYQVPIHISSILNQVSFGATFGWTGLVVPEIMALVAIVKTEEEKWFFRFMLFQHSVTTTTTPTE